MSSSFLKPSVTPLTAFAIRLRARPWYLLSSGSSRSVFATRSVPATSKLMNGGVFCVSVPFGPLNSTAPDCTLTVTPFGTGIGFLPIRDMTLVLAVVPESLPDVAEHFAADARLDGVLAGHHALRRGEDARAEAAHDLRHIVAAEVHAPAGPAHALEAGDDGLTVRAVLELEAQHRMDRVGAVGGRFAFDELPALDVAFLLEN